MSALQDLHLFLHSAVRGICDEQDKVDIKSIQNGKTVTLTVFCDPGDLKFIYSKMPQLRTIAIAIAQRNRALVNIVVNE